MQHRYRFLPGWLRTLHATCAAAAIVLGSILIGPAPVAYAVVPDANTCKNPRFAAVIVRPGDPLAQGSTIGVTNTVYTIPYSGTVGAGQCTALQTGAVWGLAFEPTSRNLYMSAAMIAGAGFGTLGSGGIYRSEEGKPASTEPFVDLDALGITTRPANFPNNAGRGLTGNPTESWRGALDQIIQETRRDDVGRISLGDLDVSPDGSTLWTVNLFDRSLVRINRAGNNAKPTAADVSAIAIPAPTANNEPICVRNEFRPWGLKVLTDTVYVGVTCTDEGFSGADEPGENVNDNLRGIIYQYNIAGNSWNALSVTANGTTNPYFPMKGYRWDHPNPNNNAYNRQLFLADLEIDDDGSFIVGMADRWPMMGSSTLGINNQPWSAGDLVRICNVGGTLTLEGNGTCTSSGDEFYNDRPDDPDFQQNHPENQTGGIALLPGVTTQVASMAYNPVDPSGAGNRSGFQLFSNQTGQVVQSVELVQAANEYGYGKAGGLGDIEVLCDAVPSALDESEEPAAPQNGKLYLPLISLTQ